ncbi:MAG TPA: HAD hydrolase-like protein, partial [Fimbriimonas sp.]
MLPPSAVLFDLDGTLTDSFEGIVNCLRHALEQLGHRPPEPRDLEWCVGPPIRQSFAQLVGETRAEEGVSLYRKRFSTVGWRENRLYPHVPEMLLSLKRQGIPLYVA